MKQWRKINPDIYKKIQKLVEAIEINPFEGIGKPEPLKYELSGLWSRRIDKKNRLIYCVRNNNVWIISCKGHYSCSSQRDAGPEPEVRRIIPLR